METVTWRRVQYFSPRGGKTEPLRWLIFNATEKIDKRIAAALRQRGDKVVMVEKGPRLKTHANGRTTLDPTNEVELAQLCRTVMKSLTKRQRLQVIYFCAPTPARQPELVETRYRADIDDKLNVPIMLTRSLMQAGSPEKVSITFVTREGQQISGLEAVDPSMAMPIGPCLVAMREYPKLDCRVIDILSEIASPEPLARRISAELPYPAPSIVTAYRGKSRWARSVQPIPPKLLMNTRESLRRGGVYLITGGLGDLGLALSRHLARAYKAAIILVSRTPVPPREEWSAILKTGKDDDRVIRMIRGIGRIEAAGGRVMVAAADVTDLKQMRAVVRQATKKFGAIHGVIHAAGIAGSTPIGLKTIEELDRVMRPKILGLAVLEQIFADRNLDFLALFSSVAALWGRAGQVDYAAANAYLDAFAIGTAGAGRWPVVSINWDTWREVGMAINTLRVAPGKTRPRALNFGLLTAEGIRAFKQALVAQHAQVIARKEPPPGMKTGAAHARPGARGMATAAGHARPGAPRPANAAAVAAGAEPARQTHPRPALTQAYRAPESELQIALAAMWIDFLRTSPIGLDDNFFELGGHSLMALQLLPRIREKYQIPLEPREFFANATIGKIAALIEDKLLSEIEEMSKPALSNEAARTAAE